MLTFLMIGIFCLRMLIFMWFKSISISPFPDSWTWALFKCLSFCQNTTRKSEERVEFLYFPPTLFSLFLQQPGRRSSVRFFKKSLPISCCVSSLEIKAFILDSVFVIQDNFAQLYEWAAKEFAGLTKGSNGLSCMAEILARAKTLSVIYD